MFATKAFRPGGGPDLPGTAKRISWAHANVIAPKRRRNATTYRRSETGGRITAARLPGEVGAQALWPVGHSSAGGRGRGGEEPGRAVNDRVPNGLRAAACRVLGFAGASRYGSRNRRRPASSCGQVGRRSGDFETTRSGSAGFAGKVTQRADQATRRAIGAGSET